MTGPAFHVDRPTGRYTPRHVHRTGCAHAVDTAPFAVPGSALDTSETAVRAFVAGSGHLRLCPECMAGPDARKATVARHVRAALLHLRAAGLAVGDAGDGAIADTQLWRLGVAAIEALDAWAAAGVDASGTDTYAHDEQWCHNPGGALPTRTDRETR